MNRPSHGWLSETMAAKGNSKIEKLTALPGVGAATAKKLVSAKIDSVSKVASAGTKKLQEAGLSAAVAKKVSAAAKAADKASSAAKKSTSAAKKATSKAKTAAKSTAKKSKTAAKSAASKTKTVAKGVADKVTTKSTGTQGVKSSKSSDGRKGGTLRIPRSVQDMPWFKKK